MTKNSISLEVDPTIMEKNIRIVKETAVEEELKNIFNSMDTVPYKLVTPTPGYCVKTFTKPDNKKIFVNICTTDAIPCPRDITNDELVQILVSEDPSNFRVPMSIGEGRTEKDNSGAAVTVYDVAIHPEFFEKVKKSEIFESFLLTVVFEGLQDKYQFEIHMQKQVIMKHRKSIGTLQTHRIQQREVNQTQNKAPTPFIEELNTSQIAPKAKIVENNKKNILYRLRREPPTGEIEYLLAEFKLPPSVQLTDLNLEVGEDRIVLDSKGLFELVDFFLPCGVNQNMIDAQLNRNDDMLTVKMPVS